MEMCECEPEASTSAPTHAPVLLEATAQADYYCNPKLTDPAQLCLDGTKCVDLPGCNANMDKCLCPSSPTHAPTLLEANVHEAYYCKPNSNQFCRDGTACDDLPGCDSTMEKCQCPAPTPAPVYCNPTLGNPNQFCPSGQDCRTIQGCDLTGDRCECPTSSLLEAKSRDTYYCNPQLTDPPQFCRDGTKCVDLPNCDDTMEMCECEPEASTSAPTHAPVLLEATAQADYYCNPKLTDPAQLCRDGTKCVDQPGCNANMDKCQCEPPAPTPAPTPA